MCKRLLVLGEWRGKQVAKCECGFIRTSGLSAFGEEENKVSQIKVGVVSEDNEDGVSFVCEKCGGDKASVKDLGEILGNEKSVTLFTCLSCGNVKRK